MYDISELQPTGKNIAICILVVTLLLVAVFCIGYMLGIRNAAGEDIHDHGNTAAGIGNAIESAGSDIGAAKSGIDHAAAAAGRIEERIVDAAERAEYVKTTANEGRRIISECQSIISEVRRGDKTGTAPH